VIAQQICSADEKVKNNTVTTHARPTTTPNRSDDLAILLRGRRSVRKYETRPVAHELLEQMLEAARWAPSPHGRQPWRFVVLTRQEPKTILAERMAKTWRENLLMDGQATTIVNTRLEKSRQRILSAPAMIIPCLYLEDLDRYPDEKRQADETIMAIQSLGAAIQNMLHGLRFGVRYWLDVRSALLPRDSL